MWCEACVCVYLSNGHSWSLKFCRRLKRWRLAMYVIKWSHPHHLGGARHLVWAFYRFENWERAREKDSAKSIELVKGELGCVFRAVSSPPAWPFCSHASLLRAPACKNAGCLQTAACIMQARHMWYVRAELWRCDTHTGLTTQSTPC